MQLRWLYRVDYGLNCVLTSTYIEAFTLSTSECDCIGDRTFKDGIKLKCGYRVGPNPI